MVTCSGRTILYLPSVFHDLAREDKGLAARHLGLCRSVVALGLSVDDAVITNCSFLSVPFPGLGNVGGCFAGYIRE